MTSGNQWRALSPRRHAIAILLVLLPGVAHAHVKWFCGVIDGSLPPVPITTVLSPLFVTAMAGFAALLAIGAGIDALFARFIPGSSAKHDHAPVAGDIVLRLGMAAYMLSLSLNLAVVPWADLAVGSLLTPELLTEHTLIGWCQLAVAGLLLVPQLSIPAATGIVLFFMLGVIRYGAFYMMDYLFFLGAAAYVAMSDPRFAHHSELTLARVPVLTATIAFSLMWTAVEKFLYPQWTISILVLHPGLTAGLPFATVATIAGFVEFSLAFYLLVGREILVRIAALLLMVVFVIAMPEFGVLDVVGHISVLTILLVMVLHGETGLQREIRRAGASVMGSAYRIAVIYVLMLAGAMALYYGLHAASYGSRTGLDGAAQPSPYARP